MLNFILVTVAHTLFYSNAWSISQDNFGRVLEKNNIYDKKNSLAKYFIYKHVLFKWGLQNTTQIWLSTTPKRVRFDPVLSWTMHAVSCDSAQSFGKWSALAE